jgi:hypothetical protein
MLELRVYVSLLPPDSESAGSVDPMGAPSTGKRRFFALTSSPARHKLSDKLSPVAKR